MTQADKDTFGVLFVAFFMIAVVACLPGCDPPPKELQPGVLPKPEEPEKPELYRNSSGQSVIRIKRDEFHQWLVDNKDAEIVTIATESVDTGDCNRTTHYVIVFKTSPLRNK